MIEALILIDIQQGFDDPFWGQRNNPEAEENAAMLLENWRARRAPILHVRHMSDTPTSPLFPGQPGNNFKDIVAPIAGEQIIEKSVNSAFIGTDLLSRLRDAKITDLVICGISTPHCVSTTSRMAANLGFNVRLAEDACAAFTSGGDMSWKEGATTPDPQIIHDMAVSNLHGEFLTAQQTQTVLSSRANG
ncbi:cysteine hydrolase family protein [Cochlodiniinecator piscidefendens]|uniref:cysteine hydrolase family protein n=1 Tax=Cochlodiniinecator piscidefendens TaxID=2715756 RepID=UPI00140A646B|nr:cysteine hydrolase family protein [Cochlodiniinecator piscidefendens]